jgi:PhoPQ-activated pathogenicity-related protein
MRHLSLFLLLASLCVAEPPADPTPLDRYVHEPDPAFQHSLALKAELDGVTVFVLDLASQRWLTEAEVNRTEWKHWVTIYKPAKVEGSTALLMIAGGSNGPKPPARPDAFLADVARRTASVTVELRMVPNQPLSFHGEPRRRTEDAIIAYTWKKFMETGDERWPARLPMTKAAVRAMDAVTEFMKSPEGGGVRVERYVAAGGSKRGWTSWTAAATDPRVVAVIPAVIDLLNLEPSFQHHWRAYGFWAPAVQDYVEHGVMDMQGTRQFRDLMKIVEPFEYRHRLTMPKFIVNSAGDQFFLPDSWQFYFGDLKGEKYLRYVPNSDHSLRHTTAMDDIAVYYEAIVRDWPRPKFDWRVAEDGTIEVRCTDQPAEVKLWWADNPDARDFRLEKIGAAYQSEVLDSLGEGRYAANPGAPAAGYRAYFVELAFPSPGGSKWMFTTGVKVAPDTYPFPPFVPNAPPGALEPSGASRAGAVSLATKGDRAQ